MIQMIIICNRKNIELQLQSLFSANQLCSFGHYTLLVKWLGWARSVVLKRLCAARCIKIFRLNLTDFNSGCLGWASEPAFFHKHIRRLRNSLQTLENWARCSFIMSSIPQTWALLCVLESGDIAMNTVNQFLFSWSFIPKLCVCVCV